jgi:hypothetical protein
MCISQNDDTDGGNTSGECGQHEDPKVAWIHRQVDLVFGDDQADSGRDHRLARIAVTTCVLIFLICLITLALLAPR